MKPPIRVLAIVGVIAVILVVLRLTVWTGGDRNGVVASGTVEITEADLGFQRPGRLDSLAVREGDVVAAGEALAWLDRTDLLAERNVRESQRRAAQAHLTELETGSRTEETAQAREALRAAAERAANARREAERAERLYAGGAISERQRDAAMTAMEVADAERSAAAERLSLVETGPRTEQIAAQRAVVAQADAALAAIDAVLGHTEIRAPFPGRVTVRHREPGETVAAGSPVLTIADATDRWVRIYVRGDQVGRLTVGQPATITADAYHDRSYDGMVTFIAEEAEFTPRTVQTTAERVKLVYRVKVRISGDDAYDLKPGLPADVVIPTQP
jgi:HlyD family secretion protein